MSQQKRAEKLFFKIQYIKKENGQIEKSAHFYLLKKVS